MALRISLNGDGPGQGVLTIEGAALPTEAVEIAIQRNLDDRYLGPGQDWRTTSYWFPVERLEPPEGLLRLRIGADVVDGVVAASTMALRIWVRSGELEDHSVLRIRGQLLGSNAASVESTRAFAAIPEDEPEPPPDELDDELRKLEEAEAQRRQEEARCREQERLEREAAEQRRREAERREAVQRTQRRRRLILALVLLLLLVLIAASIAAWQLGWLDGLRSAAEPTLEPKPEQTEPQPQAPEQPPSTASTPTRPQPAEPRGRQGAQAFLGRDPEPAPREIFTAAQEREQSGDCEGAMILYSVAADADPALALALARRYDPDTFQAGPCLTAADADTASYWYEAPAKAGDPVAQRQLGKMLTSRYSSGAVHDQGVEWLRRAAETGDQEAKTLLSPKEVQGK